jgi:hydrogenase/urease accessory protein HupE
LRCAGKGGAGVWRATAATAVALAAVGTAASPAVAHDLGFTRTVAVLLPGNEFRVDMQVDLDALALGVSQDTDNAELVAALDAMSPEELEQTVANLRQTFLRRVRVRFDGDAFAPEVTFPDTGSERARANNTVLGLTARMTGAIPRGAVELTLQASRAFPPLHITFVDVRTRAVAPARLNEMLRFGPAAESDETNDALAERLGDLVTSRQILERGDRSDPYPLDRPPPEPGRFEVVRQYLGLGFEHILPLGVDHILFVLGLFLLNTAWRPLLAQVTAFTAAHTLTLGLSTYGVVGLPSSVVEPLIALSIAWIAFENVVTDELKWWRPLVVFGFGLLHGLGFAGVLVELGLPRNEYLAALLSFNAGVELGQLTVIALAFVALGAFRNRDWYRNRVTVPLSIVIGLVGLYWTFERLLP